jgi:hypothetical protein
MTLTCHFANDTAGAKEKKQPLQKLKQNIDTYASQYGPELLHPI